MTKDIMEHLWSGAFERREAVELSPLAVILSTLLAAPMVCFASAAPNSDAAPFALYAGTEIMPGATLADVLFQEFDIDLGDDVVIYIEPRAMGEAEHYSSDALGLSLGNILVNLAGTPKIDASAADVARAVAHRQTAHRLAQVHVQ
ncbi:hypothetical protein SAMN04488523_11142 [Sulfitobacter brevis]|uniref:Uncharacterized protein n=1 Tax=Sulfitobacter brevis TaxID=74348 RepID=A0A1I2DXZ9_9RHOB|nr:hypothetical protein [Sulfitobacter brevis]SFE85219.1 hypothetical protein SAMN04488523_11142 [Sulfitobacter brevis]